MFPCAHKLGNICCGQKMFLNKIRKNFCPGHKIGVRNKCCAGGQTGKHLCWQQCVRNNVSSFARANVHVENICKKIASGIGALKRVRSFVPHETLRSIFMSLVQPHFDYCNSVWGCCSKTLASKLQKLQNRAVRILTYSNYDANADNLIKKLGWIKLDSQRTIH